MAESLEEKIERVEKMAQRALDIQEIQNVMGRYAYFHMASEEEKKYELFAKKAPDVYILENRVTGKALMRRREPGVHFSEQVPRRSAVSAVLA